MLPNLREVIDSLAGKSNKLFPNNRVPIGFQWYGIRQPDYSKPCSCAASLGSEEPKACNRCLSTGYLFTDYLAKGYSWLGILGVEYSSKPGILSTQQRNIVLQFSKQVSKFDIIVELDQNPDTGEIRQPFKIMRYFKIQDCLPLKGDSAKIEFWKCSIEERNIDSGRPGQEGTTFKYLGNKSNREPE